jgi:RNA polymerase sigma-70 factor (ECF subfamily)
MPDEPRSDERLIAQIAGGDREAFAELYRRYRLDICRFAAHMCGSPTAAEDILHEVFVAVIECAARYRPERTRPKLWLLGIARNHARRFRSLRPMLSLAEDDTSPSEPRVEPDPLGDLERQRHLAALRRALRGLPVRYREAVVLCDLQELSYLDAAAALGCAVGTVRSRLHRGRALLARRLCDRDACGRFRMPLTRTVL